MRNDVIPATGFSSSTNGESHRPFRSQTWATSRLAVPGHGRLGTARGMTHPFGRQLVEPDLSGITLGDRVRRQETELTPSRSSDAARRKK